MPEVPALHNLTAAKLHALNFGSITSPIPGYEQQQDGGMLFIGPAAEQRYGRRHFMDMTAAFTGPPEFTVLLGRDELGRIDPSVLTDEVRDERRFLLGGRSWRVTYVDWRRRRCFVEPADGGGRARWLGTGWAGLGFGLARAVREVLLGADLLRENLTPRAWSVVAEQAGERLCLPEIDERALGGLKFSAALPKRLAVATLAARSADLEAAATVLRHPNHFTSPT